MVASRFLRADIPITAWRILLSGIPVRQAVLDRSSSRLLARTTAPKQLNWLKELGSLNCHLQWRSLAEVVRRACRQRIDRQGVKQVEMFGNELLVNNPSECMLNVEVRKKGRKNPALIDQVQCDQTPIMWTTNADHVLYNGTLAAGERERVSSRLSTARQGDQSESLRCASNFLSRVDESYPSLGTITSLESVF